MSYPHRQTRTVPTAKVREWLVWFGERSTQDPKNTENRRLSNRLYDFASVPARPAPPLSREERPPRRPRRDGEDAPEFDWTRGEIPFAARPGFGPKTIERLITRVVAVTGIRE